MADPSASKTCIVTGGSSGVGRAIARGLAAAGATVILAARDRTYERQQRFAAAFKALHGSLRCPGLLGLDIGTAEGMALAREKDLFKTLCAAYVRDAAEILEEVL